MRKLRLPELPRWAWPVEVCVPEEFGRYELQDLLGRGGMGEVYRALDTVRERTVALKLLSKHLASDEAFKSRFRRESRMAARLNEPHIIPIHDFGEIDNQLFIDMRLVEGDDLGTVLDNGGALSAELAVGVIAQVASALDAAHNSGLVHRDVKPSNVLLTGLAADRTGDPFAYLVDFGIARSSTQEGTALTATTGTIGTVAYMSPERIGGGTGDHSTDVYALACVLYEALTGRKPFDGELFAIMYAHMNTEPPQVSALAPNAPPGLDEVVSKGMAKNPRDRYGTAGELARAARAALRAADTSPTPSSTAVLRAPTPAPVRPSTPAPPPATPPPPPREPTPAPRAATPPPPPRQMTPPPPRQMTPPPPRQMTPPPRQPTPPFRLPPPQQQGPEQWGRPTAVTPTGSGRRNRVIAVASAALLVAVAAVVVAVIATRHPSAPAAGPSPSTSATGATNGVPTTLKTGGPTTATVDWAHFGAFSKLVGTKNGDTAHAFKKGSCKVEGPSKNDVAGLADQVQCTIPGTPVSVFVARFSTSAAVQTYLHTLTDDHGYSESGWTMAGDTKGLKVVSSSSSTGIDITATICALPTYLVQFFVADKAKLAVKTLDDTYWGAATIPDAVPPSCDASFAAAVHGTATTGAVPAKGFADLNDAAVRVLLERGDPGRHAVPVVVPGGLEIMVVGQRGLVSFWSWRDSNSTVLKVGLSSYPYDPPSVGPPAAKGSGTQLTGMSHATFIVTGNFSGDGSGQAVAFTKNSIGWGAIKAAANGNLGPSTSGVTFSGLGLENEFAFAGGRLETAECSQSKPISQCSGNNRVLKFWVWNASLAQFTLASTAGASK